MDSSAMTVGQDDSLPIFDVQRVDMQFSVAADFVAAQVANNTLILALQTGRVMRIDLESPADIDDIDLPKRPSEIGTIRRLFMDPTASHLIISTNLGQNYYLHAQSRTPKALSRLRDVLIDCVSWNSSQPTASTREILIGAADGNIYETFLEPSQGVYRREEKYVKNVYKTEAPVCNIWTDSLSGRSEARRVLVATAGRLLHFLSRRSGNEGSGSVYAKIFESEAPNIYEPDPGQYTPINSQFAVTPEPPDVPALVAAKPERIFAWSSAQRVLHGKLLVSPPTSDLGRRIYDQADTLSNSRLMDVAEGVRTARPGKSSADFLALTQWHILQIFHDRLVAVNRLDGSVIHNEPVLGTAEKPVALLADHKKNTFWLFTNKAIFEIVVRDEDRDIWKVLMKRQEFEEALQYANNSAQKDAVALASGDFLLAGGKYSEAASVYGKSTKAFEEVSLAFLDAGQKEALRTYLVTRLSSLKKSSLMQRVLLSSWLIELFMSALNTLDDAVTTDATLTNSDDTVADVRKQLEETQREYHDFVRRHKDDLDQKTTYDIISAHGREEELLFFASAVNDHNYVLSYYIQRDQWHEALQTLNRQPNSETIYKYATALMTHVAISFVDIVTRLSNLDASKLIPACLAYNQTASATDNPVALQENQAIRYLSHAIAAQSSRDTAVHNTLISIYASHPSPSQSALLAYLEAQTPPSYAKDVSTPYDADFALRLCMQHNRIRSAIYIQISMNAYSSALTLALEHGETSLAVSVAERPEHDAATRKKLWLAIARSVVAGEIPGTLEDATTKSPAKPSHQPKGLEHKPQAQDPASIKTALDLLKRAPPGVLRIEDLLPLFPDFVLIDSFKSEVCSALEDYSRQIDSLTQEMDASTLTSARLKSELGDLDNRWVLLEPGESCAVCAEVLLERRFWVWSCGHGVHGDCVIREIQKRGSKAMARRLREVRAQLDGKDSKAEGRKREEAVRELDEILGRECVVCGELAVRGVDEGFEVSKAERESWAI
ncbi:MAG: hypothetical protein Q9159_004128 [Coniocarpon cinnabarinum]